MIENMLQIIIYIPHGKKLVRPQDTQDGPPRKPIRLSLGSRKTGTIALSCPGPARGNWDVEKPTSLGEGRGGLNCTPLVSSELGELDLDRALISGFLPPHYLSPDSHMDLKAYVHDYLKEEIQAEALTRNLPAFSMFLKSAAATNGMLLTYSNAARESGVSVKTIREYYQILQDTLIGRLLAPWKKAKKRRLIETPKFYFFDTGVVSALLGYQSLSPGTREYGLAFEHFILQKCWAYRDYSRKDFPVSFWRTASGSEVNLILGDGEVAIEAKSSALAAETRPKSLHLFAQEWNPKKGLIVSRDPIPEKINPYITLLPWQHFCGELWNGDII